MRQRLREQRLERGSRWRLRPVALPLILAACGAPQSAADLVTPAAPPPPTVVDDTDPDRVRVTAARNAFAPLVVDWQPENRLDLEVASRRGPAVVRFDRKVFELLPRCTAGEGAYAFVGVTPKRQRIRLRSRAELHANVPLAAFSLEAMISQGKSLDVDLRMIGKRVLDRPVVRRDELQGACEGATHFVTALTVGAFAFSAGSRADRGGGVGALGVGTSAKGSAARETLQQDGDVKACAAASPNAAEPPSNCAAIVRVEMAPIDASLDLQASPPTCGEGLRWDGVACVSARLMEAERAREGEGNRITQEGDVPKGYVCDPAQVSECEAQCAVGNAESCAEAARFVEVGGAGRARDTEKAERAYRQACEGGALKGCSYLAGLLEGARRFDDAHVFAERACSGGVPSGCTTLGVLHYFGRGTPADRARAHVLWERACSLRDYLACSNAGAILMGGHGGVARDLKRAQGLFRLACEATDVAGCANLGLLAETGASGDAPDRASAQQLYEKSCRRGEAVGCVLGALGLEKASHNPAAIARALSIYERACDFPPGGGCATTAELRDALPGRFDAEGYDRRACDGGDGRSLACYNSAIAYERGAAGTPDLAKARDRFAKACEGGMAKACGRGPGTR